MNHQNMRSMISAYADGELRGEEHQAVERHLEECVECRQYLEQARLTGAAIRQTGDVLLPPGFTLRVMRSLHEEEERALAWLPVEQIARRLVLGLSIAVVLFVSISMVVQPEEPVVMESFLVGEQPDSSIVRALLNNEEISKNDVLIAAVSRK